MSKNAPGLFNEELKIKSYDIHTYYFQSSEKSKQEARALRDKLAHDFAKEVEAKEINIYKLWDAPIGPHPYAMWECDFKSPEIFSRLVPWFQLNHGDLSVLVHPHTDKGSLVDHTNHAIWIGDKVKLITESL